MHHFTTHKWKYISAVILIVGASSAYQHGKNISSPVPTPEAPQVSPEVPATNLPPVNPIGANNCQSFGSLPDPKCTPGLFNPDITQANIGSTICNSGWTTKSIRPPVSYTTPLKLKQIAQYGYANTDPKAYEEDHLIALTDGGNPTDPRNLWPQAYAPTDGSPGAKAKDTVELYIHKQICSGKMTLQEGQDALSNLWTDYIQKSGSNSFGSVNTDVDDN